MEKEYSTKERIVGIATEIFTKQGFSKTTMDELSAKIGISKKTLYKHFDSKERLVREVVEKLMAETSSDVEKIVTGDNDEFIATIRKLFEYLPIRLERFGRFISGELKMCMPELWDEVDKFRREVGHKNIERVIKKGIRAGLIRKDINTELAVELYFNALVNTLTPENLIQRRFTITALFDTFGKVFFEGMLTDEARKLKRAKDSRKRIAKKRV